MTAQYLPYWNSQTSDSKNLGVKCPTRWDPDNAAIAHTYLDDLWIPVSNDFKRSFKNLDPLEVLSRSQEVRYLARNTDDKRKFRLELNKKLNSEIDLHEEALNLETEESEKGKPKPRTRVSTAKGGLAESMGLKQYEAGDLEFEDD